MMTAPRRPDAATIEAVRDSCLAVADRPVRLAEEFYDQLFAMAPQLRSMFPADMSGQMQRMTDTLLGAIAHISAADTAELEAALFRLGVAHRSRYGVESEHYAYIGHALTRAVREVAGPLYTGSLSSAWIALYQWVAAHMIAGAESLDAQAAPEPPARDEPQAPERALPAQRRAPRRFRVRV